MSERKPRRFRMKRLVRCEETGVELLPGEVYDFRAEDDDGWLWLTVNGEEFLVSRRDCEEVGGDA